MSNYASGFIPDKVSYCSSHEESFNVGSSWDIVLRDVDEAVNNVTVKLIPTMAFESSNEADKTSAVRWAERGIYNYATQQTVKYPAQIKEIENKPITNIKVLSFLGYGNAKNVYRVAVEDRCFELRSDVMMDTLLKTGVSPGGILNGEFIWAKIRKQTVLVRIGSELHRLILDFQEKKKVKPVRKKSLEFGGLYKDIRNNKAVFLGYVNTTNFAYKGKPLKWHEKNAIKPDFVFKHTFQKKSMLFYIVNGYEGLDKCLAKMKDDKHNYGYRIVKSHSYLEKIKDVEVPNDITEFLRKQARNEMKDCILEYTGANTSHHKDDSWYLYDSTIQRSSMLNLYAFDGKPVELFDIKKFLLFS